jgi:type IV pilus biogenesis protein CpaD/CtpE
MRLAVLASMVAVLAGCSDGPMAPPVPLPPADPVTTPFARVALEDALDRILPSLEAGPATSELRSALIAALEHPTNASRSAIEAALEQLIAERPAAAMEADVVRLAVMAGP